MAKLIIVLICFLDYAAFIRCYGLENLPAGVLWGTGITFLMVALLGCRAVDEFRRLNN